MVDHTPTAPAAPGWYAKLHRLWTKAVGTEGYVKSEWQELEGVLIQATTFTAGACDLCKYRPGNGVPLHMWDGSARQLCQNCWDDLGMGSHGFDAETAQALQFVKAPPSITPLMARRIRDGVRACLRFVPVDGSPREQWQAARDLWIEGATALQSLDDLGAECNSRCMTALYDLEDRLRRADEHLREPAPAEEEYL